MKTLVHLDVDYLFDISCCKREKSEHWTCMSSYSLAHYEFETQNRREQSNDNQRRSLDAFVYAFKPRYWFTEVPRKCSMRERVTICNKPMKNDIITLATKKIKNLEHFRGLPHH